MSERMLRVAEADWSEITTPTEAPLELLLRKDVAVYIKVRRDSQHIVYRRYTVPYREGDGLLPRVGFHDEGLFLRLDDDVLAEVAISRSCHVSKFSGGGFAMPRPHELIGHTLGRYPMTKPLRMESATLTAFDFDSAIIVDKRSLDHALATVPAVHMPSPDHFMLTIEVAEDDLYVLQSDYEALRPAKRTDPELISYPFDHAARMPGIYWIYQAAYAVNDTAQLAEADVLSWLRNKCAGDEFRGKRGAFAAKLVRKVVDRAKGRKGGPRPLRAWDLKNLVDSPERFVFLFVGDGLTLALAVADWWVTLLDGISEGPVVLARKLYEQNFDETEVGYLVRLITGVQLSKNERAVFEKWAAEQDEKAALRQAKETGRDSTAGSVNL